jgi:hypothetical protein
MRVGQKIAWMYILYFWFDTFISKKKMSDLMLMLLHYFFYTDPTETSFSISCCLKSYVLCYQSLCYNCFHLAISSEFMAAKLCFHPKTDGNSLGDAISTASLVTKLQIR